ncbi:MAG TPA: class I SAM-dependent methyltransferase [Ilumatobacter sp.]|jgi:ubiquinone/menaquinone biosynthesis C-methylase UbiE|nr:class I SAM-dependent methyltransferase [Ilumatobacter sp.]
MPVSGQHHGGKPVTRVHHPIFARAYQRFSHVAEAKGASEYRDRLLAGLHGRVIEVGAGNGLNFSHYPSTVTELVAVEPESFLRARAEEASRSISVRITIRDGTADALPVPDAAFDAGVASLVLCSVPDQATALAELRRVIRPGGELRFYEHVVSKRPGPARLQRIADRTIRPFLSGGCHAARDTLTAIEGAGFIIEHSERFNFRPNPIDVTSPHILGTARRT